MNYYESVFILHSEISPQEVEETVKRMEEVVAGNGGQVLHTERWGKRKLAYKVGKQRFGYYVLMQMATEPEGLRELERVYRLSEQVLKYQTVRIRKEDVGKTTLDREVMQEAIVEAPGAAPGEKAGEALPAVASQSAASVEARAETPRQEGAGEPSWKKDRLPGPAPAETDEKGEVSSPEEET